jgi:hypothetical protein
MNHLPHARTEFHEDMAMAMCLNLESLRDYLPEMESHVSEIEGNDFSSWLE